MTPAPVSRRTRGATFLDILHSSMLPRITVYQHASCPDTHLFSQWIPPLVLAHPMAPPGKTYFQLIQHGFERWYSLHAVECFPRLFAKKPNLIKTTLLDAAFSGRLDVLEWFHRTRELHAVDLPLVSIAAWAGNLQVIMFLDEVEFHGCAARAWQWASANNHDHVVHYLSLWPRACTQCGSDGSTK